MEYDKYDILKMVLADGKIVFESFDEMIHSLNTLIEIKKVSFDGTVVNNSVTTYKFSIKEDSTIKIFYKSFDKKLVEQTEDITVIVRNSNDFLKDIIPA